ncbi:hypothetical protein EDEG_04248, partial [Edhazardia aedis USNM 41457]
GILIQSRNTKTEEEAIESCLSLYKFGIIASQACRYWVDKISRDPKNRKKDEKQLDNALCIARNALAKIFYLGKALENLQRESLAEEIEEKECGNCECGCGTSDNCMTEKCSCEGKCFCSDQCDSDNHGCPCLFCESCNYRNCKCFDEETDFCQKIKNFVDFDKLIDNKDFSEWKKMFQTKSDEFFKTNYRLAWCLQKIIAKEKSDYELE